MKALTAAEMREVERLIIERYGISTSQLMEAGGESVSAAVHDYRALARWSRPLRVAVLCGKGNNGGDGLVAARHLQEETPSFHVRVYLFASAQDLRGDAAENFQRWSEGGGAFTEGTSELAWEKLWQEISLADIVVDAFLGTCLRGGAGCLTHRAVETM